ncbi:MAG: 3-deoxy-D-manno-octulosonic acid transferase, partial [Chitinophagaceae bacterium]
LIYLVSLWNPKAKKFMLGRKNLLRYIEQTLQQNKKPIIWIHVASAGELEQARPLLQMLKNKYQQYAIVLTLFSPSGYNKNTEADFIFYLPKDTSSNAKYFLEIVNPKIIFFVKYEFWYFILRAIKEKHIPLFLVSGIFRKNQIFFKTYGYFFRTILSFFTHFFVQDEESKSLLKTIQLENVSVFGDTRFDRVNTLLTQEKKDFLDIENLINHRNVFIAGSTWKKDHELLSQLQQQRSDLFFIIVPHEVEELHIKHTITYFGNSVRYTQLHKQQYTANIPVLIIDKIGILSQLYRLATITYIGGGFTHSGIHNTLEAAIWGKPVIWGKNYKKYIEAKNLILAGGGFSIQTIEQLQDIVNQLLRDDSFYKNTCECAYDFIQKNTQATEKIIQYLQKNNFVE